LTTEPGESAVYAAALNVLVVASEHLVIAGQNLPSPPARSLYSGNRGNSSDRQRIAGYLIPRQRGRRRGGLVVGVKSLPLGVQVELDVTFEASG